MFMREPQTDAPPLTHSRLLWGGLGVATALTIVLGLLPGPLLEIVGQAAKAIG
jgi:NADH:ubiquinone oxidoreductase subunit 2 (subunit N)